MDLLLPAAGIALAVVVGIVRQRAAVIRLRRVHDGESASCRALLRLGEGPWRRGRLTLAPGSVSWHGRRGGAVVDLRGAEVLAASTQPRTQHARAEDVLVRVGLARGAVAELVLHEADGAMLVRLLREHELTDAEPAAPVVAGRDRPRRRWPVVLLVLGALWTLGWAVPVLGGATVTATVVDGDGEGGCDVVWTDADGRTRSAYVDCHDEPADSPLPVWALGPPWTGEAISPAWSQQVLLGIGGALGAVGAVGLRRGRRDERPSTAADPSPRRRRPGLLPGLREDDLLPGGESAPAVLGRLAPYAARQVPDGGWEDDQRPTGAGKRSGLVDIGQALLWPAVALGLAALLTAPLPLRWFLLQVHSTGAATATSTGEVTAEGWGPVPNDVAVRYTDARGAEHVADVAASRALPEGTRIEVVYARDVPGVVRVRGAGDGLPLGGGLFLAGALVAAGFGVVRVRRALAGIRLTGEALGTDPRPVLGTLTADPNGEPLLLLADPAGTAVRLAAVPVRTPLPHGSVSAFPLGEGLRLHVRGELVDGTAVVAELPGGQVLRPAGPAWHPEPGELLVILDSAGGLAGSVQFGDAED